MKRVFSFFFVLFLVSCQTKSDLRRQQEMDKLRQEVTSVKTDRADVEVLSDELRTEITRVQNQVEEHYQFYQKQNEDMKKELAALSTRMQALEQRAVSEEIAARQAPPPSAKGFEAGKKLYEDGKFEEAIEVLKPIAKGKKSDEGRKSLFILAESYFSSKDFASAALEFGEYKKLYPKDPLVPNAIYRQANAFKSMGKPKEAKLFYQELIERYPKSNLSKKSANEMKKLK